MKKFSTWLKSKAKNLKSYYRFEVLRKAYILREDLDILIKEYINEEVTPSAEEAKK